jgi:hypothetical protein
MNFIVARSAGVLFSFAVIAILCSVGLIAPARAESAPPTPPPNPDACQLVVIEYISTADDRVNAHSSPAVWALWCPAMPVKSDVS